LLGLNAARRTTARFRARPASYEKSHQIQIRRAGLDIRPAKP
jgi:hypothetical protein